MSHAIMVPNAIAARNVDSYVRNAVSATDTVDNGWLVKLTTVSATAGQGEVFTAVVPSTSNGLTGLYMVYDAGFTLTDSRYTGLDPDPRNYFVPALRVYSVFKPQLGDIFTVTADALAGTISTNTFINATDTTGGYKPVWGATQTASVFSAKLLATTYISIGSGAIDSGRVPAYKFEVVGL